MARVNVSLMPDPGSFLYKDAGNTVIKNLDAAESVENGLVSEVHKRCMYDSLQLSASSPWKGGPRGNRVANSCKLSMCLSQGTIQCAANRREPLPCREASFETRCPNY